MLKLVLSIFGYTKEELNCANEETALNELFDNDFGQGSVESFLDTFIENCTTEQFLELKKMRK